MMIFIIKIIELKTCKKYPLLCRECNEYTCFLCENSKFFIYSFVII